MQRRNDFAAYISPGHDQTNADDPGKAISTEREDETLWFWTKFTKSAENDRLTRLSDERAPKLRVIERNPYETDVRDNKQNENAVERGGTADKEAPDSSAAAVAIDVEKDVRGRHF